MAGHPGDGGDFSDRVHQATSMVSAQLHCTLAEVLDRLIIRADASGQSLEHTALDVIDGELRFEP